MINKGRDDVGVEASLLLFFGYYFCVFVASLHHLSEKIRLLHSLLLLLGLMLVRFFHDLLKWIILVVFVLLFLSLVVLLVVGVVAIGDFICCCY